MSCCKEEVKGKAAEAACCESKREESVTRVAEESNTSECGCENSAESNTKKEEKKKATCC